MPTTSTSKSQVTLPKAIREYLKVGPGDQVEFRIVADGGVRVEPAAKPRRVGSAKTLARYRRLRGVGGQAGGIHRRVDAPSARLRRGRRRPRLRRRATAVIVVDTCVLVDVSTGDARWQEWSTAQLATWADRGPLLTNPIVFAEWCADFASCEAASAAVAAFGLTWQELPRRALFLASRAHVVYRRRGGTRPMVLADFLIGAHAAIAGAPVLTRDRSRFESYFPTLEVVAP